MRSTVPLFLLALAASAPALGLEAVPVAPFRSVELRGGGAVSLVPAPAQRVTFLEGSSQFTHLRVDADGKLVIDTCDQKCPRFYRLRLEIRSPHVPDLAINGGGEIIASGGFGPQSRMSAAVLGGGRIDASSVDAQSVTAAVQGGGELLVRARSSLAAVVNGGGLVRYWGNPAVTSAVRGGGAVQRAR